MTSTYTFKACDGTTGTPTAFVPQFTGASISFEMSDVGSLSFQYAKTGINFSALSVSAPVEIAVFQDGVEMDDGRFRLQSLTDDELASSSTVDFTGISLASMLEKALVYSSDGSVSKGLDQTFSSATPGAILRTLFAQNAARGSNRVMDRITWASFSNTTDSNGAAWAMTLPGITYTVGTSYLDVLRNMFNNGMIEFKMVGRDLRVYNAGTMGTDKTAISEPVVLRKGRDLMEAPRTSTNEQVAGIVLVVGDENVLAQYTDTAVTAVWGEDETFLSQGGIGDPTTLGILSAQEVAHRSAVRTENTHKVALANSPYRPYVDYKTSDYIYTDRGAGPNRLRVRQMVIDVQPGGVTSCSLVLNDKFLEQEIAIARRVNGILGGSSAVGSVAVPTDPTKKDLTIPAQVTGLSWTSSSYQDPFGNTKAQITATWTAVSLNTNATVFDDFDHYELQVKRNSTADWTNEGITFSDTNVAYIGVPPNVTLDVRVRAVDQNGNNGAWSSTYTATSGSDTTAPPTPSTPVVTPYLGQLRVYWDGLGSAAQTMPADFMYTEVHMSTTTGFTPSSSTLVDQLNAKGYHVQTGLTYGTPYFFKLIAVDRSGNKSSASAQGSDTPANVSGLDIAALAVDTANLANLAITTAKIGLAQVLNAQIANLAVDNAKIANVAVGKLTAGSLIADITVSARIKTANTGARVEMNSSGFQAYNSAGTLTVDIAAATGAATFTGTLKTDFSSSVTPHVEMTPFNNTIWMTSNDGLGTSGNAAFMNGPLDAGNVPQIGINTGIFPSYDGVSGRHRLFMQNASGIALETMNQGIGGQVGYGLYLHAADASIIRRNGAGVSSAGYSLTMDENNFFLMRTNPASSQYTGGSLQMDASTIYLYRYGGGVLNGGQYYADTGRTLISGINVGTTNSYLSIEDSGQWDQAGKFYNNTAIVANTQDLIICGSATGSLGTSTSFTITYGPTMVSRPGVVYSYYGSSQETSRLSAFTTTGFTIVMGSSVSSNFQYWAFRV